MEPQHLHVPESCNNYVSDSCQLRTDQVTSFSLSNNLPASCVGQS